jgi:hypothetical protein
LHERADASLYGAVGEGGAVVRRGAERFGGGQGAGKQQWTVGEGFGDRDGAVD